MLALGIKFWFLIGVFLWGCIVGATVMKLELIRHKKSKYEN